MKKRLVVGLSGASGAILCVSLLEAMRREKDWEVHLVTSEAGERVLHEETGMSGTDLAGLAFRTHDIGNIGAAIASGTFETEGMAVVPCSMKTLAGICHGYAENLLLRAADVTLKERRKLVLVARETPLGLVHLRNMTALAEMGVTILPPMLTYYQHLMEHLHWTDLGHVLAGGNMDAGDIAGKPELEQAYALGNSIA